MGSIFSATVGEVEAAGRPTSTPAASVRPCPGYGPGFVQVPSTGTCMRIGGRVRAEAQAGGRRVPADGVGGLRSEGRLDLDSRTQTDYGPVRTFVRVRNGNTSRQVVGIAERRP